MDHAQSTQAEELHPYPPKSFSSFIHSSLPCRRFPCVQLSEMSSEIVPILEGSESARADTRKESNAIGSRPQVSIPIEIWSPEPEVKVGLTGGDYITKKFLASNKGHKYVSKLNPTLDFIKGLLEKINEPSVLLLRGCGHWFLQSDFPLHKFKSLTALEITPGSNNNHLTAIPENTISEMTQLQSLNLSHLLIKQLASDFFHKLTNLCFLVLRGCSELGSLPSIDLLQKLEVLDLSYCASLQELESMKLNHCHLRILNLSYTALLDLPIQGNLRSLTHLLLRDVKLCYSKQLGYLNMGCLEVIDLSGVEIVEDEGITKLGFLNREFLAVDLSRTPIKSATIHGRSHHIRFLILQECTQLKYIQPVTMLTNLEVLDLSGCETLVDLPEGFSDLGNLKELNLSGCSCLRKLSEGLFDQMSQLEILDLSKTNFDHLPSFANLISLQTLNLSHTPLEKVPDLSSLINLKELLLTNCQKLKAFPNFQILPNLEKLDIDLPQNDRIDFVRVHSSGMGNLQQFAGWEDDIQGDISKPLEFHLVSTFISNSGFDRFKYNFIELDHLMAKIQKTFKPSTTNSNTTSCSTDDFLGPTVKTNTLSPEFKRLFESMRCDLKYILESTDLLESSPNCKRSEELLNELVDVVTNHSANDFPPGSTNLKELLRIFVKLKLLVPPKQVLGFEKNDETKIAKKKKPRFLTSEHKENIVNEIDMNMPEMQELLASFQSLTSIQRDCLLYFAIFPCSGGYVQVKDRILIHLWFGEGLFDPLGGMGPIESREEHIATQVPEGVLVSAGVGVVNTYTIESREEHIATQVPEGVLVSAGVGVVNTYTIELREEHIATQVPEGVLVSAGVGVVNTYTIEDVGRQILEVLTEKGFVFNEQTKSFAMATSVHHFVRAQAIANCFFDFNHRNGRLTPHLMGSQRACLLKSQHNFPSSCNLWEKYCTSSSEKLESFKIIRTLLNVDDPVIDIKVGWFSKMSNLSVLHLGSLDVESHKEHVDVMDLKFLDELQNMEQLKVVSLEGFSVITRLPDSICKVTNLKILHLRYCSNLEELPRDIGSLKNLTHLDLTQCHSLSRLPKGVRLLYKLEVLKGFVITYEFNGRQHKDACTVRDLLALQRLRKLSIVVSKDEFPSSNDLHVLNNIKNLVSLMITWKRDPHNIIGQEELRPSKWQRLKCWKQQTHTSETEEPLGSNSLSRIEKLVLCCFPSEIAPSWLHPSELQKLKKLYIMGGKLETLPGDTDKKYLSVETLRLRYLHNFQMDLLTLKDIFPDDASFHIDKCPHFRRSYFGRGRHITLMYKASLCH